MPTYSYSCPSCSYSQTAIRTVRGRNQPLKCSCGSRMTRSTVNSFTPKTFEPYFDEGLGSDVYSEQDRRILMREQGVIEAGDPVHGGRNFDAKAPHLVQKVPPCGHRRKKASEIDQTPVETVDSSGRTVDKSIMEELPKDW